MWIALTKSSRAIACMRKGGIVVTICTCWLPALSSLTRLWFLITIRWAWQCPAARGAFRKGLRNTSVSGTGWLWLIIPRRVKESGALNSPSRWADFGNSAAAWLQYTFLSPWADLLLGRESSYAVMGCSVYTPCSCVEGRAKGCDVASCFWRPWQFLHAACLVHVVILHFKSVLGNLTSSHTT